MARNLGPKGSQLLSCFDASVLQRCTHISICMNYQRKGLRDMPILHSGLTNLEPYLCIDTHMQPHAILATNKHKYIHIPWRTHIYIYTIKCYYNGSSLYSKCESIQPITQSHRLDGPCQHALASPCPLAGETSNLCQGAPEFRYSYSILIQGLGTSDSRTGGWKRWNVRGR